MNEVSSSLELEISKLKHKIKRPLTNEELKKFSELRDKLTKPEDRHCFLMAIYTGYKLRTVTVLKTKTEINRTLFEIMDSVYISQLYLLRRSQIMTAWFVQANKIQALLDKPVVLNLIAQNMKKYPGCKHIFIVGRINSTLRPPSQ